MAAPPSELIRIVPSFENSAPFPTYTPITSLGALPNVVISPLLIPFALFPRYIPIPPSERICISPLVSFTKVPTPAIPTEFLPIRIPTLFIRAAFGLLLYIPMLGLFLSKDIPISIVLLLTS